MNFEAYLRSSQARVGAALDRLLPAQEGPQATVARAMRYAVLGGGKRLRPTLVLASCEACGGRAHDALAPAAAIEMIHTYSLIHDDLPAMDNDDYRRGRPTVHKAFGESVAILAGDGLLTSAFEILGTEPAGDALALRRTEAVATVARAAGISGMVGGQIADLESGREVADAEALDWIHRHKTGALLAACAEVGAIHAGAGGSKRTSLRRYGEAVGLAFQIADDILDLTSTREALGKTPGKDHRSGKATYPALFGVEASHLEAERLVARALSELAPFREEAAPLAALARYAVSRSS